MDTRKLTSGEKHLMRLIAQDADAEGWTAVSKPVYPLIDKLPGELVQLESVGEGRGRARLTESGQNVLNAMVWL